MNNNANNNGRPDSSPPRHRHRTGDGADPAVERAFDYLLNTLFARSQPDQVASSHRESEDGDVSDIDTLEPLSPPAATSLTASTQSNTSLADNMDIDSNSSSYSPDTLQTQQAQDAVVRQHGSNSGMDTHPRRRHVTTPNDDTDNDMPGLLDISDSDEDANDVEMIVRESDDSVSGNSRRIVNAEDEIVRDLADMPALEPVRLPRRTTVEDDPEEMPVPPLARTTLNSLHPYVVRTGSRRTRDEVDDAPESSPSVSEYATPINSPAQTPRTGTPASVSTPNDYADRPTRPLPRNGQPPTRIPPTNATAAPSSSDHSAATPAGQTFDANALFRHLFGGLFNSDPARPTSTQTNDEAGANSASNINSDQSQARPRPVSQTQTESGGSSGSIDTGRNEATSAARGNTRRDPLNADIDFIDDGEDITMADGFPEGSFFAFGPLHEHREINPFLRREEQNSPTPAPAQLTSQVQDGAPQADVNTANNETGGNAGRNADADTANGAAQFDLFLALMRAMGGAGGLGGFGNLGALFNEMNREDPARARRLVAGMEPVTEGLAKRMERVGGAPGLHEDAAAGEEAQCAVCWDSLWNAEGDSFESLSKEKESVSQSTSTQESRTTELPPQTSDRRDGMSSALEGIDILSRYFRSGLLINIAPFNTDSPVGITVDTSQDPPRSTPLTSAPNYAGVVAAEGPSECKKEGNASGEKNKEFPTLPKVVSLPCAHVFHSSCLLPWFSRPGQTTCPVCRFNIDPENLSYRPLERSQPPSPQAHRQPGNAPAMPGLSMPMGPSTGAPHWTIHTGPEIGPEWIMHGIRPQPTAAPTSATTENATGTQQSGTEQSAPGSTQTGNENGAGGPRLVYQVPPIPPFAGRPQNGPYVHPNINLHRFQADRMHHAPPPNAQQQPGPRFQRNADGFFIHVRPGADGQGQSALAQAPQQGPQLHPNIHPNLLRLRELFQRQQENQRQRDQHHTAPQAQTASSPPPPENQQQHGAEQGGQEQHRPWQMGMVNERFSPESGGFVTMNIDFFFGTTGPGPEGERQNEQMQQANEQQQGQHVPRDTTAHVDLSSNSDGRSGSFNAANTNQPQQGTQVPRQGAGPNLFFEIFTRNIPVPMANNGPVGGPAPMGTGAAPRAYSMPAQRRERKEWTSPPPPGLTLRQRIEKREREAGLRCDDVSCGLAPTDEDPTPEWPPEMSKVVAIRKDGPVGDDAEPACTHRFHAACLVDAGRVAGWGVRPEDSSVELSCPVCRTVGHIEREEWEAAERASSLA
ncbi:hypothetical protein ACEPAG_3028 [Sanghuangporus baumii]